MPKTYSKCDFRPVQWFVVTLMLLVLSLPAAVNAAEDSDEALYQKLSQVAFGAGPGPALFEKLNSASRIQNWESAEETQFVGNLRILKSVQTQVPEGVTRIYLLRKLTGELYILSIPEDPAARAEGADSTYAGLDGISGNKMVFNVQTLQAAVDGEAYPFARFTARPAQMKLDRLFKISIILMLFFVMVGMGMTLTFKDFALVFTKPRGIILGEILQFGFMPFLAMCLGRLLGFYDQYPFIFVGMILITATPGGGNFEPDDLLRQGRPGPFHIHDILFDRPVHRLHTVAAGPILRQHAGCEHPRENRGADDHDPGPHSPGRGDVGSGQMAPVRQAGNALFFSTGDHRPAGVDCRRGFE